MIFESINSDNYSSNRLESFPFNSKNELTVQEKHQDHL